VAVAQQDEDTDFDGIIDRRFRGTAEATVPEGTKAPPALGKFECGSFDRFWRR